MPKDTIQFGPFKGYVSSIKRHLVTPEYITAESANVLLDPVSGELQPRMGSTIVGDTISGGLEVSGILEAKWGAKSRKAFPLSSTSFSDGYQTHASLWTKDTNAGFPTADAGFFGALYVRNELGTGLKNYNLLSEFSTTTYPASNGTFNSEPVLKVVPLWYESGEGGYTRGVNEFNRRFLAAGSRSLVQTDQELFLPNLRGTPLKWNKSLNGSTTGTEKVRIWPTGPLPPLWCPTFASGDKVAAGGVNDSFFKDGTTFYCSVLFEDQYGNYSMPAMPRPVNATLTAGFGLVTVGTAGGASYYSSFTLKNITLGPSGTRRRLLLACDPQILGASAAALTLRIAGSGDNPGLKVLGVIENNTQTSFVVSNMDLLQNDNVVRFDHVMPRRGRYLFTGDQRVVTQVTLPNPAAIILAPVSNGSDSAYDLNAADDSSTLFGSTHFHYRVTSTELDLYCYSGGALAEFVIDFATYDTLQAVVDKINSTTVASSSCKAWRAQLAPGVDGTMASTKLCETSRSVTGVTCTSTQFTMGGGDFSAVPIGAFVDSANFPAGTYVVSKASSSSITVSAAATGTSAGHAVTFYAYCGDGATYGTLWAVGGSARRGLIRAHSGTYPGMVYLKRSAMQGYDRIDTQSVYFTKAAPGDAAVGASLSPNGWVRSNRRLPPPGATKSVGKGMGGVDIAGGALVGYTDGLFFLVNERGGNTGEDVDVRLKTININSGVVCDTSWAAGNGWGSYLKATGYYAADRNLREMCLSRDIHNPSNGNGDLAGEIGRAVAALDTDGENVYCHAAVMGKQLHLSIRTADANNSGDRRFVYDFSTALDASGLEQLVNPETRQTFGWSSGHSGIFPCAMTEVRRSDGLRRYFTQDTNSGTNDGRMDQFDSGTTDNGTAITISAVLATVLAQPMGMLSVERAEVVHTTPSGAACYIQHAWTKSRADSSPILLNQSSDTFRKEVYEFPEKSHSNGEVCELTWGGVGIDSGCRLARVVVEFEPAALLPQ